MPNDNSGEALSFEDALKRLEETVRSLESGDTPLAQLIERYEQGSALLRQCEARLREAELRIEQLRPTKDGVSLEKFSTPRS